MQAVNTSIMVFMVIAILFVTIYCMYYLIEIKNELKASRTGAEPENAKSELVRNWAICIVLSLAVAVLALFLNLG